MKKIIWFAYCLDYIIRNRVFGRDKYKIQYCKNKKRIKTCQNANPDIKKIIESGEPFFAGRIGFFEMAAMRAYEFKNKKNYNIVMKQIYDCAGFFPNDITYGKKFLTTMTESLKKCDMLGCSWEVGENYFINNYLNVNAIVTEGFDIMEPWKLISPWTYMLENRKVLVVHPFNESIQSQYTNNRDKIFIGLDILPDFELITYRALQTTGDLTDERFSTWFEALDFMVKEISQIDFDIALIGCGAYGFPLGARIKDMGKQAIHMGGSLQLLFGIMGKRWDGTGPNSSTHQVREDLQPFFNEHWVYPSKNETPTSASRVEYGPYWK